MADILIPWLKKAGYNYLELMPLAEYPSDDSWGYQGTGFFGPTSRYGTADQLKAFVNACHQNGIGVILDFVPVHFAVDDYALARYDGTALYEYPHSAVGQSEWGSCNFMHSRGRGPQLPPVGGRLLAHRVPHGRPADGRHQPGHLLAGTAGAGREPERGGIPGRYELWV